MKDHILWIKSKNPEFLDQDFDHTSLRLLPKINQSFLINATTPTMFAVICHSNYNRQPSTTY